MEGLINFKRRGGGLSVQMTLSRELEEGGESCADSWGPCCGPQQGAARAQALDQGWEAGAAHGTAQKLQGWAERKQAQVRSGGGTETGVSHGENYAFHLAT